MKDRYTINLSFGPHHGQRREPRFTWKIDPPTHKEVPMLELTCTNEQKIKVVVNPVTATGKPAALDGAILVEVQSGEGTVELVDATTFYVVSGDNPGDTAYLVSADADVGAGVETISDIVMLHVEGAKAQSLGLVASPPEAK